MMISPTGRDGVRRLAAIGLAAAVVGAVAAGVYGVIEFNAGQRSVGLAFVGGALAGLIVALFLYCQVILIFKSASYVYRGYDALLDTSELVRRQEDHIRLIAENSSLSEWAKRVVYREKDYEFLRDTIHAAIIRQDWEAAEHLIRDMEVAFGYRDEAARLGEELRQARQATDEERIKAALTRFEKLCETHRWDQARRECERLNALFPGHRAIASLPAEIERHREAFKERLLQDYDQAVRNQDIERAHRLLFALDQHLAPSEAERIKASARDVFRARLEQLKTRFTLAVSYKQFQNAIDAGERLVREFPNSGYAQEISKLMPVLQRRAEQQQAGHATPTAAS